MENTPSDIHYLSVLENLKSKIHTARMQAALVLNNQLLLLYHDIGKTIVEEQTHRGYGTGVIDALSKDLRAAFPAFKGLSPRNLHYMKSFAVNYPDFSILQQAAAKLPWAHICVLMDKVKDSATRDFYASKTVEEGWSRAVLEAQIESGLISRVGNAITNFDKTLPAEYSDLARETLKNPYSFGFLSVQGKMQERDLEEALIEKITHFLLELGKGFAFVGKQKMLEVGGDAFFPDLIFYHIPLRCYFVIDLKMKKFKPEYSGKMNFYLTAVDKLLKLPDDKPSIGLLLCKEANHLVAEYALLDINKPIGVSTYHFSKYLPDAYKSLQPDVAALEKRLEAEIANSLEEEDSDL